MSVDNANGELGGGNRGVAVLVTIICTVLTMLILWPLIDGLFGLMPLIFIIGAIALVISIFGICVS